MIDIEDVEFDDWMKELRSILPSGYAGDEEAWKPFYDDGYSPEDALAEDLSAG